MKLNKYAFPFMGVTLLGSFFLEHMVAAAGRFDVPPFLMLVMLAWFPAFSLPARLWLGGGVGLVVDSLADLPFGTMILLYICLAFLAEFFRSIISERESYLAKGMIFLCLGTSAFLLLPIARGIIEYLIV